MTQNLQWRIILIGVVLAVSAFLVYPSVGPVPPFWAKYLPNNPVRLGLDLQGGLYLVLEVQADMAVEAVVDQSVLEASALMKDEKIRYNDIQRTSPTSLTVYLKDADQAGLFDEKVLDKLQNYKKGSAAQTDKGFEVQLQMDQKTAEVIKQRAVRQAVDTIRNRVDAFGVAEPDVVVQGADRIVVQLPGLKEDINRAIDIIKKTARLEFKLVDENGDLSAALKGDVPAGDEILYQVERSAAGTTSRKPLLIKKQILMTGDSITDAKVQPGHMGGMIVHMDFNRRCADLFERITGEHVRERLAI